MRLWLKVLLGVLGAVAVIALVVLGKLLFILYIFSSMCKDTVVQESVCPEGKVKAVVYVRDCGATTNYSTQVALMPSDATYPRQAKTVLVTEMGNADMDEKGAIELHLTWEDSSYLDIECPPGAWIVSAEDLALGIHVRCRSFPPPQPTASPPR